MFITRFATLMTILTLCEPMCHQSPGFICCCAVCWRLAQKALNICSNQGSRLECKPYSSGIKAPTWWWLQYEHRAVTLPHGQIWNISALSQQNHQIIGVWYRYGQHWLWAPLAQHAMCHKVSQTLTQWKPIIRGEQLVAKRTTDITTLTDRAAKAGGCRMM